MLSLIICENGFNLTVLERLLVDLRHVQIHQVCAEHVVHPRSKKDELRHLKVQVLHRVQIFGVFENLDPCFQGHILVQKHKTDRTHHTCWHSLQSLNDCVVCRLHVGAVGRFRVETDACELGLNQLQVH